MICIVIATFYACDPMYHLTVANYTDKYQQVTLRSKIDSATYYKVVPNEIFKEGDKLETKVLFPLIHEYNTISPKNYRLVTIELPPYQRVILDTGIGRYVESPIVINGDTIKKDSIKSKFIKTAPKGKLGGNKQVIVLK